MKEKVLKFLQTIPKGKVVSYKDIAIKFGTHPRAIAVFMKYNKYPDVYPCYKVVSASRKISGYSGENGVDGKIERLKKDGIIIKGGKIGEEYFLYK